MFAQPTFARPTTVDEAIMLLDTPLDTALDTDGTSSDWSILSGGTDFYPALQDKPITRPVMDISAIEGWRSLTETADEWRIGALCTWTDVIRAKLPPAFDALKLAAREVGSVQIQNRATVVGNLCNASPAADGVPPLLIVDANVELVSSNGTRVVALSEFIRGNRDTVRQPNELVSAVLVPKASCDGASGFIKLGARKYLVISIAMVATRLHVDSDGRIAQAAVAVGACSAVARRMPQLEHRLVSQQINESRAATSAVEVGELTPIDDVRASADYRLDAVPELIDRVVDQTLVNARGNA